MFALIMNMRMVLSTRIDVWMHGTKDSLAIEFACMASVSELVSHTLVKSRQANGQ